MTAKKANKALKRIKILLVLSAITVIVCIFAYSNKAAILKIFENFFQNEVKLENKIPPKTDENNDDKTHPDNPPPEVIPDEDTDYEAYKKPIWNISNDAICSTITLPAGSNAHASLMLNGVTYFVVSSLYNYSTESMSALPLISIITFSNECRAKTFFTLPFSASMEYTAIFPNNHGFTLLLTDSNATYCYTLTENLAVNLEYKTLPLRVVTPYITLNGTTLHCLVKKQDNESDKLIILTLNNDGICLKSENYTIPLSEKILSTMSLGDKTYISLSSKSSDILLLLDKTSGEIKSIYLDKIYNFFPYSDGTNMFICAYALQEGKILRISYDNNLEYISQNQLTQDVASTVDIISCSSGANTYLYNTVTSHFTAYSNMEYTPFLSFYSGIRLEKPYYINGKQSFISSNGRGYYSIDTALKTFKFTELPYELAKIVALTYKGGLYTVDIKEIDNQSKISLRYSR